MPYARDWAEVCGLDVARECSPPAWISYSTGNIHRTFSCAHRRTKITRTHRPVFLNLQNARGLYFGAERLPWTLHPLGSESERLALIRGVRHDKKCGKRGRNYLCIFGPRCWPEDAWSKINWFSCLSLVSAPSRFSW